MILLTEPCLADLPGTKHCRICLPAQHPFLWQMPSPPSSLLMLLNCHGYHRVEPTSVVLEITGDQEWSVKVFLSLKKCKNGDISQVGPSWTFSGSLRTDLFSLRFVNEDHICLDLRKKSILSQWREILPGNEGKHSYNLKCIFEREKRGRAM